MTCKNLEDFSSFLLLIYIILACRIYISAYIRLANPKILTTISAVRVSIKRLLRRFMSNDRATTDFTAYTCNNIASTILVERERERDKQRQCFLHNNRVTMDEPRDCIRKPASQPFRHKLPRASRITAQEFDGDCCE